MAEPINKSAEQTLTHAEFKQLALTDINKWLTAFLGGFNSDEDDNDREELRIDQAGQYEEYSIDEQMLGLHIELVHDEGGYEGGGEHAEKVFAVLENDNIITHFRITGYYNSYDGTEWNDEVTAVAPREVMVTQYFNVDGSEG